VQRQQHGDEESLNNGSIFVKCYLTCQRAKTKPSGMLCLKTGLKDLNHIEIGFFVVKFTFAEKGYYLFDLVSRKFAHFAEAFFGGVISFDI